ncbi:MAG TPA: N-acetylmuramic acid 6-phosphate etherase [Thermoanaerobaculia bacterium]|nr:N-acetylmuramic acid 6-phosphate etherase [Thermoanaerobaculia bacterium]
MSSGSHSSGPPLDTMPPLELVEVINDSNRGIAEVVAAESPKIAQAVEAIADRMRHGGRLFYAGAGTSGRIALLDASELNPTFGIDDELVQVILAGGQKAFVRAVEGAEDREEEAIAEVTRLVRAEDSLVGIAASGTTPFTVAAVRRANMLGCLTIGITSAAGSPLSRECDIPIVVDTGPEVIEGSTRMKSGTAQKMVLNTISTAVMILLGKVHDNLMIEMPPTNAKLRERAIMMVSRVATVDRAVAARALADCDWNVKTAIVAASKGVAPDAARRLLESGGGNLREVLER